MRKHLRPLPRRNTIAPTCILVVLSFACSAGVRSQPKSAPSGIDHALLQRASSGDPAAEYAVGKLYSLGTGVAQDRAQAVIWYQRAADQNYAPAENELGNLYLLGGGVSANAQQAVIWWEKAADQGFPAAESSLGTSFETGHGAPQDYAQAAAWYRRAADQGDGNACLSLARLYYWGSGVERNHAESARWYLRAAQTNDEEFASQASAALAEDYYAGDGVPADFSLAAAWAEKAAPDPYSADMLGHLYYTGKGVRQDHAEAARWYLKAAETCDILDDRSAGYCESMEHIGLQYLGGDGVPQDYSQAIFWLRKSAELGDSFAQESMGWIYSEGLGVPKDEKQAQMWWRKAADQGDARAKTALDISSRTMAIGPSAYQTAVFDGWTTVPSGVACRFTATASPGVTTDSVAANGAAYCDDSDQKKFSVLIGDYRYEVVPEYSALAYMPFTWIFYAGKQTPLEKLPPGTEIRVRRDGSFLYILNAKGKELKFDIASVGSR